jgi:hypothetical protein
MDTFQAVMRGDRHARPETKTYRFLTRDECKLLKEKVLVRDQYGRIGQVKILSVQVWKTRPDVKVSWKYGLYDYGKELIATDSDNKFFVAEVQQ